jgi:flagellum-specific peptidoglycan hydrolase FlgJ
MTNQQFIDTYAQDFVDACYGTGLFPSVAMAQAALESGWGSSQLSAKYNAFFGIKAQTGYLGTKVLLNTTEEVNGQLQGQKAYFRTYRNYFDGLVDRNNFLKENKRYTNAGVFTAATPEEQAKALQKAGYATNSDYSAKLIELINQNNLKRLDAMKPNKTRTTTQTKVIAVLAFIGVAGAIGTYLFIKKNQ